MSLRVISLENHKKKVSVWGPYVSGWKTSYGPTRKAYGPAKTIQTILLLPSVFLKMSEANICTVSSIILVNFWKPKCCNYLLTTKEQRESHCSRVRKLRNLLRANKCTYDKMLIDWVRLERTCGVDGKIFDSRSGSWAKYFPVQPSH